MKITPIKTHKIKFGQNNNLFKILKNYLPKIKEKSILVITSKIISICEANVNSVLEINKQKLVKREADFFLPREKSKYNITLTLKNGILTPTAGVDESNGNGYYILWPKSPQKTANRIRQFLQQKFALKNTGVIITDSRSIPLIRGTVGFALAHSGFKALNDYRKKRDLFGKKYHFTSANIRDSLATAAVVMMGEGNEQTPLALLEDLANVQFQNRNPSKQELSELSFPLSNDLYAPLFKKITWEKAG